LQPYKVLISIEILQLHRPARGEREKILSFLESLANDLSKQAITKNVTTSETRSKSKLSAIMRSPTDHAVKEVKVVRFEKADRR